MCDSEAVCLSAHHSALTPDANANVVRCFCFHSSSFILFIKGILPQTEPSLINHNMLFIFSKNDFTLEIFTVKKPGKLGSGKSEERKNTFIVLCCCIVINHAVLYLYCNKSKLVTNW